MDGYEWDPAKAAENLKKHEVDFADAAISLEDPNAFTDTDSDASDEERNICLGIDPEAAARHRVYLPRRERPDHFVSTGKSW
jgi:uncharacterized DUF497 family protein